ncbi:unnamed protein product [Hymenolepis diminuta]|uniref:Uncharacterized protein n=1 Tax=Hymenolepis diminuta TaxID=6216 RepID=A0A564Z0Y0_HYMDI|nr:unnamed protein product [Hymenolepis diminuta]
MSLYFRSNTHNASIRALLLLARRLALHLIAFYIYTCLPFSGSYVSYLSHLLFIPLLLV